MKGLECYAFERVEAGLKSYELEFDPAKRSQTLKHRGLDFLDCNAVFLDRHLQFEDDRLDYGELRLLVFGWLDNRRVVIVWTPRSQKRRIISMRYAHAEEFELYRGTLD